MPRRSKYIPGVAGAIAWTIDGLWTPVRECWKLLLWAPMCKRPKLSLGIGAGLFVFALVTLGVLLLPAEGRYTEADFYRTRPGMTLEEVEAILGPAGPDEEMGVIPRLVAGPFMKGWRGEFNDIYLNFDAEGRVESGYLAPRRYSILLSRLLIRLGW